VIINPKSSWSLISSLVASSSRLLTMDIPLLPCSQLITNNKCQGQTYFTTGGLLPISSSWRQAPWGSRPDIFFNWTLAAIVIMKHPLWREHRFAPCEYAWPFVKCTYGTYSMLMKVLPVALYTSPLVSTGFAMRIMPILRILCYNGNLVIWTVVKFDYRKV
jgi:hypothetical protein